MALKKVSHRIIKGRIKRKIPKISRPVRVIRLPTLKDDAVLNLLRVRGSIDEIETELKKYPSEPSGMVYCFQTKDFVKGFEMLAHGYFTPAEFARWLTLVFAREDVSPVVYHNSRMKAIIDKFFELIKRKGFTVETITNYMEEQNRIWQEEDKSLLPPMTIVRKSNSAKPLSR